MESTKSGGRCDIRLSHNSQETRWIINELEGTLMNLLAHALIATQH